MFKAIFRSNKLTVENRGKDNINFLFNINIKMTYIHVYKGMHVYTSI